MHLRSDEFMLYKRTVSIRKWHAASAVFDWMYELLREYEKEMVKEEQENPSTQLEDKTLQY